MATKTKSKKAAKVAPQKKAAKKIVLKLADRVKALVSLRSKVISSDDESSTGVSFASRDEQDVTMELLIPTKHADELKVDGTYLATILPKGKSSGKGCDFTVVFMNEVDNGSRYDEKMVVKGTASGHIYLEIKPNQEKIFFEQQQYVLQLEEVEAAE